jgi:hypothetical protein
MKVEISEIEDGTTGYALALLAERQFLAQRIAERRVS